MATSNPEDLSAFERQIRQQNPVNRATTRPPKTITIHPHEFLYSWDARPSSPIIVGLRLLSVSDQDAGHAEALREGEEGSSEYRTTALAFAVARGICDPNDVSRAHPTLEFAEDMVPAALSQPTIARIFDEIEKLAVETVPLFTEATDADLRELAQLLSSDDPFEDMSPARARRVRRYLKFALSEFTD